LHEFNWSRSLLAGAFSVFMISHGLIGPFAGNMVDRYGPKPVFLVGSLMLGVGFFCNSLVRSSWHFYLSFGLVSAVGLGLIGWVPNTTVIQQWFRDGIPAGQAGVGTTANSWTLRRAAVTKTFWILAVSFFLANFTTHAVLTHHVAFLIDQGMPALSASYIAGMLGVVSIGAKISWGMISDRIGRQVAFTIGMACSIGGILLLIGFAGRPSATVPYLYALCFGLGYAASAALPPLIAADLFHGKAYGTIFGTLMMINNGGGASGAWFAGLIHDRMHTYVPGFVTMILFSLLALVGIWMARPRRSFPPSVGSTSGDSTR